MRDLVEYYRSGVSGEILKKSWQSGLGQCTFCLLVAQCLSKSFGQPGSSSFTP